MSDITKITLNEALNHQKGKEPRVKLIQSLAAGELEAEGMYSDNATSNGDGLYDNFQMIRREVWLSHDIDFENNQVSGSFALGDSGINHQERYENILVLWPTNGVDQKNKGGRRQALDQAKFNAEIAAYFMVASNAIDPCMKNDRQAFLNHICEFVPCAYEFINGENFEHQMKSDVFDDNYESKSDDDIGDKTKTLQRRYECFFKDYKSAYDLIEKYEEYIIKSKD